MPELSPELRSLRARVNAHKSWAATEDRSARTAKARAAREAKFLAEANGDPVRAESLRKAFYAEMALKSALARRRRADAAADRKATVAERIAELDAEIAELSGDVA